MHEYNRMPNPAQKLLKWYDKHGRALPWRNTRDPYRILVSEVMLQQTQVPRVLLFYGRWIRRFPSWKALARASNAQVIREWAGLGYNRRALMLRNIARQVVERGVPKSEAQWRELKGVGPYTAAALACFSLHERTMPVDTNIRRVLNRFLRGVLYHRSYKSYTTHGQLNTLLPKRGRFYDVPQALFDLATLVCKKIPDCAVCPLRAECKAAKKFLSGRVRVPKAMVKKPLERRHRNKKYPDRIYRGRILAMVRQSPRGAKLSEMGQTCDPSFDPTRDSVWFEAMVDRLVADNLVVRRGDRLTLP
jgi:A/G-specific adenine glycosylase